MIPLLLGTLAFVDGTLCGFRAAAGRNPRLFLWRYYAAAMRRGALFSLCTIAGFLALSLALRAAGGPHTWDALLVTADAMVRVYGVYATLVVLALGLYLSASFDFGVLASVLVLGPFTLIRPWVILCGAGWAAWHAPSLPAAVLALAAGAVMALFEPLLNLGAPPWRGLEGDALSAARRTR